MNSSIFHDVPVMIQPQTWACWYTSYQMVVAYYRRMGRGNHLKDPSEVPQTQSIFTANEGIGNTPTEREEVAHLLGFATLAQSVTSEGLWDLLARGPVIYSGRWPGMASGHVVVIVGISGETILINDPGRGRRIFDYNEFAGRFLLQTAERILIYSDR